jgi:chromosomal replication initiator protein
MYKKKISVRYVPSEKFVNDVVSAIRNKRMEDIKDKYRSVDVLIVDDIQFIAGKERSEEEFFHTFNVLYENNKQIVISSDRPPAATPVLEERLRSRFEGGMIADISYPDYEMRLAIIKTKLQEKGAFLSDEVCSFIASKIQRNVRELEGVLNKAIFYQEVKNISITPKVIEEIIDKTIRQSFKNITPNQIIQAVAGFFEISDKDIINHSRRKEVVEPRQIAMFLLKDLLGMSFSDIGNKLGKRDHTTVIHACDKIAQRMNIDQNLNNKIILIKEIINNK